MGSGPTTRYDFGLEDVEAALTIQYLARDARMPVPPPYTSHALQLNQWIVGKDQYEGDQKQVVSGGWGLGRGVCSNCRVDETEAVCWWTDPVVKTVLGLNRRLCYACGVFKYNNLVDRPVNIGRQVLRNLAPPLSTSDRPIQTQPCPNKHSRPPLQTVGTLHPNIPYTDNMASYRIPIKPYSKVQGGWYDQGLTGQGELWQPEIQHNSWVPS
ncbi:hypothetical protein HD553DRAFT_147561 [Filobasidium floriforme]|uniref:uncharacterized protein n=1 Tax=Filobasidium floriforme TaxID=5210 RepID=UPI001E8E371B|nr:uncharacterized protein HD553DRAFT_147561 [Filobasidium floriforme]KAH8078310.1 hypothetical protein HD553DRAFT_147561 [Filobasidium floriforme]